MSGLCVKSAKRPGEDASFRHLRPALRGTMCKQIKLWHNHLTSFVGLYLLC